MPSRNFGWIRDSLDHRDIPYTPPPALMAAPLPAVVDLRRWCGPVGDQGKLGSCSAWAWAGMSQFLHNRAGGKDRLNPSPLFIYYEERKLEDSISYDSGAQLRDGARVLSTVGAAPETAWPYIIDRFTQKPDKGVYAKAANHKITKYKRINNASVVAMRTCLASGNPFVLGFTVFKGILSDEAAKTGQVPMPVPGESQYGGHAVLAVGYDVMKQAFLCRNSWGPEWGMGGYFEIPFAYLTDTNLASDFWTASAST